MENKTQVQQNDNESTGDNNEHQLEAGHDDEIQCRMLLPSLLNKSAIHAVNLSNSMLLELPPIPPNTQKLLLNYNMLSTFPIGFTFLKEISISNNRIESLPDEINTMECLRVIRANNNQITTLPFLKFIRHLELNRNPINLITTKLSQTRLQRLAFDWLPFLIINHSTIQNYDSMNNDQQVFYELCDLISRAQLQNIQQFVDFTTLFQVNNRMKTDISIGYLLHRAVSKKSDFFINFLKDNFGNINYNELIHGDQLLLEFILEQKYSKALELYKLKRSNLNETDTFMSNLLLACKYNNMDLFNYMVKTALRREIIRKNEEEIVEVIFRNFQLEMQSDIMLGKILQLAHFNRQNKKVFHLPHNYSLREAENISEGILFVLKNQNLSQLFSFQFAVWDDILEPLLHFAMASRRSGLVKIILEKYKSPFVKNYAGKFAKTIRGSTLCRKLIMKYQKIYIKQRFQESSSEVSSPSKSKLSNERWFEIVYDKNQKNKIYGTPIKYKSFDETVCMGEKLQSAERSIHKRNVLPHRLKTQPKPKLNLSISFSIPSINSQEDTGILYDFVLAKDKTLASRIPMNVNKMSNLGLYEAYQQELVNNLVKDYDRKITQQPSRSFIFSPLSICQDVKYDEQQREVYFQIKNNRPDDLWDRNCGNGQPEVSESGEISLNQQF